MSDDTSIDESTGQVVPKKGRPMWMPTPEQRRQIKLMSAIGTPQEHIAKIIGVSEPTLRRACKQELLMGGIEANIKVSQTLFQQATNPKKPNITACIWWEKTRQGRSERPDALTGETPAKKEERKIRAKEVSAAGRKLAPGRGPRLVVDNSRKEKVNEEEDTERAAGRAEN